jgi:hypothetical protein
MLSPGCRAAQRLRLRRAVLIALAASLSDICAAIIEAIKTEARPLLSRNAERLAGVIPSRSASTAFASTNFESHQPGAASRRCRLYRPAHEGPKDVGSDVLQLRPSLDRPPCLAS